MGGEGGRGQPAPSTLPWVSEEGKSDSLGFGEIWGFPPALAAPKELLNAPRRGGRAQEMLYGPFLVEYLLNAPRSWAPFTAKRVFFFLSNKGINFEETGNVNGRYKSEATRG